MVVKKYLRKGHQEKICSHDIMVSVDGIIMDL